MQDTLLIEVLTEELPPKALKRLSQVFCDALVEDLRRDHLLTEHSTARAYATPRRLAVCISNVLEKAPDQPLEVPGPSVKTGLDADGKPTPALVGFAKKNGVPVDALVRIDTPKGKAFACRKIVSGARVETNLESKVEEVLRRLPVPKMMRWGAGEAEFVRPVHGLVMLHGTRLIPGTVLGLESRNFTLGHRFMSEGEIGIPAADDYASVLEQQGSVIASFDARKQRIRSALEAAAAGARPLWDEELLDEVTALVECPEVYAGGFSAEFLSVPQECLVLSMKRHQKYFPLAGADGRLQPRFLMVSNLRTADPGGIIHGNERVLRARLADAKFFYDHDRKTRLEARVPKLAEVVYHNRLGSQLERVERVQLLAGKIARHIGADPLLAERAAWLSKADLLTDMVGEFPELQGIMGRYYARADGETPAVAEAIGDQYKIRFDADESPQSRVSMSLFVADRVETLVGIWGIGLQPTGDKDPFGLRRAALGLISAVEILGAASAAAGRQFALSLRDLLGHAAALFKAGTLRQGTVAAVTEFVYERYRNQLTGAFDRSAVDAVISLQPPLHEVLLRTRAVVDFGTLPEAAALAAANKRARNILRKEGFSEVRPAQSGLLVEAAEIALAQAVVDIRAKVDAHYDRHEYFDCLRMLARLKTPVDAFFDQVLVNAEDAAVRANRLALLSELDYLLNKVADISKLAS